MYEKKFLTPAICRAARALLGWSQDELARQAGVGRVTIADYERGKSELMRGNIALITAAFDAAGVEIIRQGQGGVVLR
ncbi:helix-turn-helix domain-containing protein [Roseomonas rosulenta]|uniref:helix-turn-helix domain-containing protein n=1 Tax=Roseomonas rosulenta TaxID=2748667 RepID=UPI0018E01397|nr:helix-turn-helix transcriptional regulator [Roseomonas rosulenta]